MTPHQRYLRVRRAIRALASEKKRLSPRQLAAFAVPLTWPEIHALEPVMPKSWWRHAVIDADEYGRGLLRWLPDREAWVLTERGRSVAGLPVVDHSDIT
jgi:hypothetical protein